MSKAYYNDNDPYVAAWLRNLIDARLLPDGDVDERSIKDVHAWELDGYTQVHLFAGIGGWPLALRMAQWPDDRPVWTGSCPCQPFSNAGRKRGTSDDRHLWPEMFRLVRACKPDVIFGEQVASKAGLVWLDGVSEDLEVEGYSCGAADLSAAGVGAPHKRQRLYWVGHTDSERREEQRVQLHERGQNQGEPEAPRDGRGNDWAHPEWILCDDPGGSRWRPTEPGALPLVDGFPGRMEQLRAYGNSLVPELAAEFVRSCYV